GKTARDDTDHTQNTKTGYRIASGRRARSRASRHRAAVPLARSSHSASHCKGGVTKKNQRSHGRIDSMLSSCPFVMYMAGSATVPAYSAGTLTGAVYRK